MITSFAREISHAAVSKKVALKTEKLRSIKLALRRNIVWHNHQPQGGNSQPRKGVFGERRPGDRTFGKWPLFPARLGCQGTGGNRI